MKLFPFTLALKWVLWLIAVHSICYGICLIVFPPEVFDYFGFSLTQTFFADQGGVFHLIISSVYIFAAWDLPESSKLIGITCFVKFSAFIFLMAWYIFGMHSWIILISGILDLLMGIAVLILFIGYRKSIKGV